MSRNLPIRSASSDTTSVISQSTPWLDSCLTKMSEVLEQNKTVVDQSRERNAQNLLDKINLMLTYNPQSGQTVEAKVQELKQRMGLDQFLRQQAQKDLQEMPKFAQLISENELFAKLKPVIKHNILNFIRNLIENSRGFISIPAVQTSTYDLFKNQGLTLEDLNDEQTVRYINQVIAEFQARHTQESSDASLGKNLGNESNETEVDYFSNME